MESFYDVTLVADNQTIAAHRSVLSQASLYFKKAFGNANFSHKMVFPITIVSYEVLVAIVKFIYTGKVDAAKHQMASFVAALESFGINFDQMEAIASQVKRAPVAVKRRDSSENHEIKKPRLTMHILVRAPFGNGSGCNLEVRPQNTINDVMLLVQQTTRNPLTGLCLSFGSSKLDGCASLGDLGIPNRAMLLLIPS